jgi:hypothetical protein
MPPLTAVPPLSLLISRKRNLSPSLTSTLFMTICVVLPPKLLVTVKTMAICPLCNAWTLLTAATPCMPPGSRSMYSGY